LLCVGGVHFEPSFRDAVLGCPAEYPIGVSHILANHWLVAGGYAGDSGRDKLRGCAASVVGGINGIAFHESLKGPQKAAVRGLAEELGIPAFSHRALRRPHELPLW